MMEVLLDGRPLDSAPTPAHALAQACSQAEASGRVVVEASLDGVGVDPEALVAGESGLCGGRLEFVSAVPRDLAGWALDSAATALDEIKPRHRSIADAVRDGNFEAAMAELSGVLTTWNQAKAALERSAQILGFQPDAPGGAGSAAWASISPALASLAGRLAEIKRALTARDWAGLADVFEYDMDQQADEFAGALRGFARSATKP